MREIVPARMYKVVVYDENGMHKDTFMNHYPQTGVTYYKDVEEANEDIHWRKKNYPQHFDKGDKIKIVSVKVDEEVLPNYYTKFPFRGGRRWKFTPEERKRIREEQEESESYGPPYNWFPQLPDEEIEGADEYQIFMNAAGWKHGKKMTDEMMERGKEALREYREGIRDRKKKSVKPKTKRPFGKKAGSKLQSFYGIKTDIGGKAGNMLQSIYRVKTATSSKSKRKVTRRK